jgi:hypothetical protein
MTRSAAPPTISSSPDHQKPRRFSLAKDRGCKNFLPESPLQPAPSGLGFALFLTPRLRDGEGGYCGCPTIKLLILWQLEFE